MTFNGWLCIDKPLGMSSAQVVGRVKHLLNLPKKHKIGHAGTLDPLASGVLPLALGEATKTIQYVMVEQKSYAFTVQWGEQTSTDDAEGEVIAASDVIPTQEQIQAILPQFTGKIQQTPPTYSAIKVDGKRAYMLARAGEEVKLKSREVEIFDLNHTVSQRGVLNCLALLEDRSLQATFQTICSKGTYIRSLARDMAHALGTVGHVSQLRRTATGKFHENNAISLDLLEKLLHKGGVEDVSKHLLSIESVLDDILAVSIGTSEAQALRHGQMVTVACVDSPVAIALHNDKVVAIVSVTHGRAKPSRVFNG